MRKTVAIFGTLLITVMILISGSAVAAWVWANHYEAPYTYCSNPGQAVGAPDGSYASLGFDGPPPELGWILLDLTSSNAMGSSQDFRVVAATPVNESYAVWVCETTDLQFKLYVGSGWDTENLTFTTPSNPPAASWRYIYIMGTSGVTAGAGGGDYEYGPDIDAVGWDK